MNAKFNLNANVRDMSLAATAIAIPTYFSYVEKAYASDAQTQIKTLLEECKIWKTTHRDFPSDIQEMIDEGFGNISRSTLRKWAFEIDLQQTSDGSSDLEGTINATSLEDMPGGIDKKVCFDVETGVFAGYGTKRECGDTVESSSTARLEYEDLIDFNISNFNTGLTLKKNNIILKSNLHTNFFTANLDGDIDFFDIENPWINDLRLNINNINNQMLDYIDLFEEYAGLKIEKNQNSITISLTGYLNDPQIKGIGPVNK